MAALLGITGGTAVLAADNRWGGSGRGGGGWSPAGWASGVDECSGFTGSCCRGGWAAWEGGMDGRRTPSETEGGCCETKDAGEAAEDVSPIVLVRPTPGPEVSCCPPRGGAIVAGGGGGADR